MSAKYGLTSAMSDAVGGYEKEEQRRMGMEKAERGAEMEGMKLQQMRGQLQKEGVADSVRLMLAGDMQGAMDKYNATGEDRMTDLEFDPSTGLVSFTDVEGNERDMMIGQLMVAAGIDPRTMDTPEAKLGRDKDLIEHRAKMNKKYGIGAGKTNIPADIQRHQYWMKTLTGGDPQKAFKLMQLAKDNPSDAYAMLLKTMQAANDKKFPDDPSRKSPEELRKQAAESVKMFQTQMFEELWGSDTPKQGRPQPQRGGVTEKPSVFNEDDPMGLRTRGL